MNYISSVTASGVLSKNTSRWESEILFSADGEGDAGIILPEERERRF